MRILRLNRAELLVNDADGAQNVFETLFNGGLYEGDHGVHNRPLDCRTDWRHGLELVHPTSPDEKIAKLLAEKGEHVFTVVWEVEDIAAAKSHLERNGFEIQYEGDYSDQPGVEVHKQLVIRPERTHGMLVTLMERRMKVDAVPPPARDGFAVLGISRVELLVDDPDAAEADLGLLFDGALEFERDVDAKGRPLDCRVDWRMGLELVHPNSVDDKIGRLLADKGQHVFTVVWDVADLDAAKAHLAANGFEIQWEGDFGPHGDLEIHKQLVVLPTRTHGLLVIFQERRERSATPA